MENPFLRKGLMVLAAYGIVQILAQDLGVKTGKKQRDLVQSEPVLFLILFAGAFAVTEDLQLAFGATALYYFLKYFYSKGITADVCFEEK